MAALIRRNMALSAAINAVFSLGFFLAVFGWPKGVLAWGEPDKLALDFLPQSAAVALMSALVPVLVERRAVARLCATAPRPVRTIVLAALGWSIGGAMLGGLLALSFPTLTLALAGGTVAAWAALAGKLVYGAALGAVVTGRAIRQERTTRIWEKA